MGGVMERHSSQWVMGRTLQELTDARLRLRAPPTESHEPLHLSSAPHIKEQVQPGAFAWVLAQLSGTAWLVEL